MVVTTVAREPHPVPCGALSVGKAGDGLAISPLLTCAFPRYSQCIADKIANHDQAGRNANAHVRRFLDAQLADRVYERAYAAASVGADAALREIVTPSATTSPRSFRNMICPPWLSWVSHLAASSHRARHLP